MGENVSDLYLCYSTWKRYIISYDLCGTDTANSNIIARKEIQTENLTASLSAIASGWYVMVNVTTMQWEEREPIISECEDTSHQTQNNGHGMFEMEEATDAESTSDWKASGSSIIIVVGLLGGLFFVCYAWMRMHARSFYNRQIATNQDDKGPTSTLALSQIASAKHHDLNQKIEIEDDGQMETTADEVILYIR